MKILSKSIHNLLSNGQISDLTVNMVIWIATKIYFRGPFTTLDTSIKISSQSILNFMSNAANRQTERQTDQQTQPKKQPPCQLGANSLTSGLSTYI